MPNVLKQGPYRFFFYSAHVHVKRDRNVAKFWFDLVRLQRSGGFRRSEIRDIERIVRQYQILLIEEWNDYFND